MSDHKDSFQVDDVLVKFGKLYKIFQIKTKEIENKKVAYYKPIFIKNKRDEMICSIPLANISQAFFRKPLSKTDYQEFLSNLSKKRESFKEKVLIKSFSDLSGSDNLEKKSLLLSHLWYRKQHPDINLSTSEQNLFADLIESVLEELAFVLGLNLETAKKKIFSNLATKNIKE